MCEAKEKKKKNEKNPRVSAVWSCDVMWRNFFSQTCPKRRVAAIAVTGNIFVTC